MKKLLSIGAVLSIFSMNAQVEQTMPVPSNFKLNADLNSGAMFSQKSASMAVVNHQGWYFYDKHSYRTSQPTLVGVFSSPSPSALGYAEFGSSFLNPNGQSLVVTNVAVIGAIKTHTAAPTPTAIPVRITVYNASPLGTPGSSVATAMTAITSTAISLGQVSFTASPLTFTNSFFISAQAVPTNSTDTAYIACSRGYILSSTVAPQPTDKFTDTLGYLKRTAQNFSMAAFTSGYAPEFFLIPTVSYTYAASTTSAQSTPAATVAGAFCANAGISYTNNTAGLVMHRQYNFNAFQNQWKPLVNTTTATPVAEPVSNWAFLGQTPAGSYTTTSVTHTYSSIGNATGSLTVKYQSHGGTKLQDAKTWTLQIVNCGITGVNENSNYASVAVYPNPAINGKTKVSGLQGVNTISVVNVIGQVVYTATTDKDEVEIDLTNQIPGTYVIKIANQYGDSKVTKIINE